jgi:anthranilate phosphoribosyltransferase
MIKECIAKVTECKNLSDEEAKAAFDEIMGGKATDAQIASLITALRMKGETVDEIKGAATSMMAAVAKVEVPDKDRLLDVVGTGGDKKSTFNISTCSAIVAAGAGCIVAKHGNRAVSGATGAADVLNELGVNIELTSEQNAALIRKTGLAFLFAPRHHPAMKHAIGPRREIGIRTIFNILGPITNPADSKTFLLGVYSLPLAEKLAHVLAGLHVKKALVVHGDKGEDELSISGPSTVFEVTEKGIKEYKVRPAQFGLKEYGGKEIVVESTADSAAAIKAVLEGREKGAKREVILLNAGAAIYANNRAKGIKEGVEMAAASIDSGKAMEKLNELIRESRHELSGEGKA